jgi:hypothetical protein
MAGNGCEWLRMDGNSCERLRMAANDWEWLRMDGNGSECPNSFFPLALVPILSGAIYSVLL